MFARSKYKRSHQRANVPAFLLAGLLFAGACLALFLLHVYVAQWLLIHGGKP